MEELILKKLGFVGKILAYSKSKYFEKNPNNLVVFNSNLIAISEGKPIKIWYGDLDLTLSLSSLCDLSSQLNKTLFVLRETDARFENEHNPKLNKFVLKIEPSRYFKLGEIEKDYYCESTLIYKELNN